MALHFRCPESTPHARGGASDLGRRPGNSLVHDCRHLGRAGHGGQPDGGTRRHSDQTHHAWPATDATTTAPSHARERVHPAVTAASGNARRRNRTSDVPGWTAATRYARYAPDHACISGPSRAATGLRTSAAAARRTSTRSHGPASPASHRDTSTHGTNGTTSAPPRHASCVRKYPWCTPVTTVHSHGHTSPAARDATSSAPSRAASAAASPPRRHRTTPCHTTTAAIGSATARERPSRTITSAAHP